MSRSIWAVLDVAVLRKLVLMFLKCKCGSQYPLWARRRPKRCSCFFFFAIQCPWQHVTAKNGIPDQTDGIYTLFQTKMPKSIPYFSLGESKVNTSFAFASKNIKPPNVQRHRKITVIYCSIRGAEAYLCEVCFEIHGHISEMPHVARGLVPLCRV